MGRSRWLPRLEVVGTFAVLATLVVLIVEVRTNTNAIRAA